MKIIEWLKSWFTPSRSGVIEGFSGSAVEDTEDGKLYTLMQKRCPDCGRKPPVWLEGPSGGMSTNIFCAQCGAGFNSAPIIHIAQRIGTNKDYILSEEEIRKLK